MNKITSSWMVVKKYNFQVQSSNYETEKYSLKLYIIYVINSSEFIIEL